MLKTKTVGGPEANQGRILRQGSKPEGGARKKRTASSYAWSCKAPPSAAAERKRMAPEKAPA